MKTKPKLPGHFRAPPIKLKPDERAFLKRLLSRGRESVRVFKRARLLQVLDEGLSGPEASKVVGVGESTVRGVRNRYFEGGLKRALYDAPRPGKPRLFDARRESQVVAMVCSRPPEGLARWSIALIAKEAVDRGIVESAGDETIRRLLQRHALKPWREKNVVRHHS